MNPKQSATARQTKRPLSLLLSLFLATVLTVGCGNSTEEFVFTGTSRVITNVDVQPPTASLTVGQSRQFVLETTFSDGTTVTTTNQFNGQVAWDSDNEAVATIDENGLATGLSPGTATITGTLTSAQGVFFDTATLTVTPAANQSPQVNLDDAALAYTRGSGDTAAFPNATVTDDQANLANGTLTIEATGNNTGIDLTAPNTPDIGTVTDDDANDTITVALNNNATPANIQSFLRAVQFQADNTANFGSVTLDVTLTDGQGGNGTDSRQVNIQGAAAQNVTVAPSGADFTTIQAAVNSVAAQSGGQGSVITVSSGDFTSDGTGTDGIIVINQLSLDQEFALEVRFQGQPQPVSHPGVPADLGWLSNEKSTVTFNGAARSSSWLPGDDSPSNKATYDFLIEVPEFHFAVANGQLVEVRSLENGGRAFHYRTRFPMASYLASVNTFDEREFCHTEIAPGFEVVYPKGMEQRVRDEFQNHARMMRFLESRLGPYPFDTYGAIVTNLPVDSYRTRFTDGKNTYEADSMFEVAFEAQTRPIFQAESITGNGDFEPTIIHEMAHQWFGNAVTNASEIDVWVNEAFPSYCGWLWLEETRGPDALENEMRALHDSVKDHVFNDTTARPDRDKLFSQENYARMTLSMHAMRRLLGDAQFYQTLAGAVEAHKYKSVDVESLAGTMNELNEGRLSLFLKRWLHGREIPAFPKKR